MGQTVKGILFITLSAVFFASYGLWSRLMGDNLGEFTQAYLRGIILVAIFGYLALKQGMKKIQCRDLIWFAIISLCGGLNQMPYYYAFQHLPIGTATMIFYAALTIGGYLVGKLVLFEKMTLVKITSLFLTLIGLWLLYSLSLSAGSYLPGLAATLAGLMGATEVSLTKKVSSRYSIVQILFSLFLTMLVGNLVLAYLFREPLPVLNLASPPWLALVAYSLSMLLAMATVVKGYRYMEASVGGLVGLSEVLFAIILGLVFFGESLGSNQLFGGALILSAAALPHLSDHLSTRNAKISP